MTKRHYFHCGVILAVVASLGHISLSDGPTAPPDAKPVPLTSELGCRYLKESQIDKYVELSNQFVTQDNTAYCGVASSIMVLNASGVDRPIIGPHNPGRLWTQDNFWTDGALKVTREQTVRRQGMTLDLLGQLLAAHDLGVSVKHSSEFSADQFKAVLSRAVQDPRSFVLINYYRPAVGQEGGGHISPVAAYDSATDMFLILDVARYRYEPIWVPNEMLYQASVTVDASANASRGFVVCRKLTAPSTSPAAAGGGE